MPASKSARQQSLDTNLPFPSSPSSTSIAKGGNTGLAGFIAKSAKFFSRTTSGSKHSLPQPGFSDATLAPGRPSGSSFRSRNISGPSSPRPIPTGTPFAGRSPLPASRSVHDLALPRGSTTDDLPRMSSSQADGDLRRMSGRAWARSADDLSRIPSTPERPRPSIQVPPSGPNTPDREAPHFEAASSVDQLRKLPLSVRIEAYRNGATPQPGEFSHHPTPSKSKTSYSPVTSSPLHTRVMPERSYTENLLPSPSTPPLNPLNNIHHRSQSVNPLANPNLSQSENSAPETGPRPGSRSKDTERADRVKSMGMNNLGGFTGFGFGGGKSDKPDKPVKQASASLPQRASQIILLSGFLNRNTGTAIPRDLSKDWKAYKVEIKGSKLYFFKPPTDRSTAVKDLFVSDLSQVREEPEIEEPLALQSTADTRPRKRAFWGPGKHPETAISQDGSVLSGTFDSLLYEVVFAPLFGSQLDQWTQFAAPVVYILPVLAPRQKFESDLITVAERALRNVDDEGQGQERKMRVEWIVTQYSLYSYPEPLSPSIEDLISSFSLAINHALPPSLPPLQVRESHTPSPRKGSFGTGSPQSPRHVLRDRAASIPSPHLTPAAFNLDLQSRGLSRDIFIQLESSAIVESLNLFFRAELHRNKNLMSSQVVSLQPDDARHPWFNFFGTDARPHWLSVLIVQQILSTNNSLFLTNASKESPLAQTSDPHRRSHSASTTTGVQTSKTHLRSQCIIRWIHVAERLRKLGNECAWLAIDRALCSRPIARLEKAWRRVDVADRSLVERWAAVSSRASTDAQIAWLQETVTNLTTVMTDLKSSGILAQQGLKTVFNAVNGVHQKWISKTAGETTLHVSNDIVLSLCKYWQGSSSAFMNVDPQQTLDSFMSESLVAESVQRTQYAAHHRQQRSPQHAAHAIMPFIFPEPLPSITILETAPLVRIRKESLERGAIATPRPNESQMKKAAQFKLLSDQYSLVGLGGQVGTELEGETLFRLFDGQVLVKVSKDVPSSRPTSGTDHSFGATLGANLQRKPSRTPSIRAKTQAASTLERKPSAARRQSLPLLSQRGPMYQAPGAFESPMASFASESTVPVVIIGGSAEKLVDVLVRGLDYITATTADDNGEMALRESRSRTMKMDREEFSKTWWNTYRSFMTPEVFLLMLIKLFDTTLSDSRDMSSLSRDFSADALLRISVFSVLLEWVVEGGGTQDLLDNPTLWKEMTGFLNHPSKHIWPPAVQQSALDRPAWEELDELRSSLGMALTKYLRRPPLKVPVSIGPLSLLSEPSFGPYPPDMDQVTPENLIENLDAIGATALRYIQAEDLVAVADLMEVQSADRTGWLTISEPQFLSQDELEIQTIYSFLQMVDISPFVSETMTGALYKALPPSVRGALRAHTVCRRWVVSRLASPGIGRSTRQMRMELVLQAVEICRNRSTREEARPDAPAVRTFVETVLTSAILSPESRLYHRSWTEVAQARGSTSIESFDSFLTPRVAFTPSRRQLTVDFGWILERMLELTSLPDTLQDDMGTPGLINFEKRRHLHTLILEVPSLVPARAPEQKAQLDRLDADRMAAMLEEATVTLGYDNRIIKDDALKENNVTSQTARQRPIKPFISLVLTQQEKNKRDRQFREHFAREKKVEQQRLDKQGHAYDKSMGHVKSNPFGQHKTSKQAKRSSNAFVRLVRPLSTALLSSVPPPPTRKWSLSELDFEPTSKPSHSINLDSARAKPWSNKARSFVFIVDSEDGGRHFLQATNQSEMNKWIQHIQRTAMSTAEKRRTYLGPGINLPELAPRIKDLGRHPTAVFAVDLGWLLEREYGREYAIGALPAIVDHCIREVEHRGFQEIGIYRISGGKLVVDQLKSDIDAGHEIDLGEHDIHTVCSLLKLWLREIPGGLFPGDSFWQAIEAIKTIEGTPPEAMQEGVRLIQDVIDQLPIPNYHVLKRICEHLITASTWEDTTNMAEGNFAICFSQSLLCPPNNQAAMIGAAYSSRFISILLNNYHTVFEREADEDVHEGGFLEGLEEETEEDEDELGDAHDGEVSSPEHQAFPPRDANRDGRFRDVAYVG